MEELWNIYVSGYGTFTFSGTEDEAEEMRVHKARWEGGSAMKWRAENQRESDRLTARICGLWANGEGVPQKLLKKRREAIDREAQAVVKQSLTTDATCKDRLQVPTP